MNWYSTYVHMFECRECTVSSLLVHTVRIRKGVKSGQGASGKEKRHTITFCILIACAHVGGAY